MQHSLHLNENVEGVLASLSKGLESTGLVTMKPPPSSSSPLESQKYQSMKVNNFFWATQESQGASTGINHAFDVNTNRGRDLLNFINNVDRKEIEQRKADRIDASAAALVARQAFKFQSIDGTGLGWSSSSLAKCLKSLTKCYDEHNSKFRVNSFYPFQLILSNDEFHEKLDVYGGKIMLNPGSTHIQWLELLMAVTEDTLSSLETNRKELEKNLFLVQNSLNVKLKKGFSCSSLEYYIFLKGIANMLSHHNTFSNEQPQSLNNSLALNRVVVVVETDQACRRPVVTPDGEIRISSSFSTNEISSSVSNLRSTALENINKDATMKSQIKDLESMLKYEYGVTKVYKNRFGRVTNDQYLHGLSNILTVNCKSRAQEMKRGLAGNSLGIVGSGHCHLGDDGTFLIPWDWH